MIVDDGRGLHPRVGENHGRGFGTSRAHRCHDAASRSQEVLVSDVFFFFFFFCWPLGKRDVSTGTSTSQTRKSHTGPFVFTGSPRFSAAFAGSVLHPDSPDVSARTASGFCGLRLLAAAPAAVLGGLRPGSRWLCRQAQRADGAGRQNPPGPALERPRRGGKSSAALPGVSRDKHRGFT